jgi:hypothetical protein
LTRAPIIPDTTPNRARYHIAYNRISSFGNNKVSDIQDMMREIKDRAVIIPR